MTRVISGRKGTKLLCAALLGSTALIAAPAVAQSWNGSSSKSWIDPANWSPNGVPTTTDTVTIDTQNPNPAEIIITTQKVRSLTIGDFNSGQVTIDAFAGLTLRDQLILGNQGGSSGTLALAGGASVGNTGDLTLPGTQAGSVIGNAGTGLVSIDNGIFTDQATTLGAHVTGVGTINLTNLGYFKSESLVVGDLGSGTITVAGGSGLGSDFTAIVGNQAGSSGTITITGQGSKWGAFDATIGNDGAGTVNVSKGGEVDVDYDFYLGQGTGGKGTVTVDGAGSSLSARNIDIGGLATSTMKITNGAHLTSYSYLGMGNATGVTGTLQADGNNTAVFASELVAGGQGFGEFDLSNGAASVVAGEASIADGDKGGGRIWLRSTSEIEFDDLLDIGKAGYGELDVEGGVAHSFGDVVMADQSTARGQLVIDNGVFTTTGALAVGKAGQGDLELDHNAQLDAGPVVMGQDASSVTAATMFNASSMVVDGDLTIGLNGSASLQVAGASSVRADGTGGAGSGTIFLAKNAGSTGTLILGDVGLSGSAPGIVDAAKLEFGDGTGQLTIDENQATPYSFYPAVGGGNSNSTITLNSGVVQFVADSSGFKGTTLVQALYGKPASLQILGNLGGDVQVGGTGLSGTSELTGIGTVLGTVTVTTDGTLSNIAGQTLTVGALNLDKDAHIDVTLGNTSDAGLFDVKGDMTLDGTLDILNPGAFGQGVYRLFDYGGTLTDNGLDIGTVINGTTASDLSVQTSVAGQVNLVYGPNGGGGNPPGSGGNPPGGGGGNPPPAGSYSFWDGDAAGNAGNGKIDGADGNWTAASTNFTDANGAASGTYDPSLVVFEGQGGTVTIDNSAGQIKFDKLQFAADGYQLQGDDLTLDKNVTIWVGDGSAQSAGYSATIANRLTGNGGLTKTDLGTLILTGNDSYTGGTTIGGGVLLIGNGGTSGSIVGDVDNAGTLGFDRSDDVMFDGVVSGTGALEQYGSGTVTLTGANTYTGETGIGGGTIALGGAGSVASSSHVYLEFGTFDISGASGGGTSIRALQGTGTVQLGANTLTLTNADGSTFYGAIIGSGGLHVASGTAVLASNNTYTGGTVIDANGVLAVGDGTTYGSITGDIVDNGGLGFNRSDAVTFAGDISGNGLVAMLGSGSLTLTGSNSYTGGTVVTAGTLRGDTNSLQGQFQNASHLVFAQAFDGKFNGGIFGAGDVTKMGAGTLTVAAPQSYTGTTTVNGGGLILLGGVPNSDVTVNAGLLGGYGPLKSLNVVGGTLSPGQSPGTMTVAGNATLGANSTYMVDLASGGVSDLLAAGGKVALGGGALVLSGTGQFGIAYQIIGAQAGVTGTFGSVTGGVAKPFTMMEVSYQPNAVLVTDTLNAPAVIAAGRTPNEVAAAKGVVDLPVTSSVVAAIANLDATAAPGAFDQLSGEIHASVRGAITEDARAAGDRLLETIARRRGLWGEATVGGRRIDGDGNAAGLRGSVRSILVGTDGGSDTLRGGLTAGYGWDDVAIAGRDSSARMEAWRIGGYLVAEPGRGFELKAAGLYSHWRGDVSRGVTFAGYSDRLSSRDSAGMVQGMAELGWKANAGKAVIEPFGSLDWVGLSGSTIKEKGGAAALTGRAQRQDSWFGKLGVRASTEIASGSVKIEPRASLAWERAFGDRLPAADLGFAGSASGSLHAVTGQIVPRGRVNGELGFDVVGKAIDIGISAGGSYADRTSQTSVKLHMRWEF